MRLVFEKKNIFFQTMFILEKKTFSQDLFILFNFFLKCLFYFLKLFEFNYGIRLSIKG